MTAHHMPGHASSKSCSRRFAISPDCEVGRAMQRLPGKRGCCYNGRRTQSHNSLATSSRAYKLQGLLPTRETGGASPAAPPAAPAPAVAATALSSEHAKAARAVNSRGVNTVSSAFDHQAQPARPTDDPGADSPSSPARLGPLLLNPAAWLDMEVHPSAHHSQQDAVVQQLMTQQQGHYLQQSNHDQTADQQQQAETAAAETGVSRPALMQDSSSSSSSSPTAAGTAGKLRGQQHSNNEHADSSSWSCHGSKGKSSWGSDVDRGGRKAKHGNAAASRHAAKHGADNGRSGAISAAGSAGASSSSSSHGGGSSNGSKGRRPSACLKAQQAAPDGSRTRPGARRAGHLNSHKAAALIKEYQAIMEQQEVEHQKWLHQQELKFLQLLASGASQQQLQKEERLHNRLLSARLQRWGPPVDRAQTPQYRAANGSSNRRRHPQQQQQQGGQSTITQPEQQQQQQQQQRRHPVAFEIPDSSPEATALAAAATAADGQVQGFTNQQVGAMMIVDALSKEPMNTQVLDSLEIVFLHLAMPKLISYKLHHLVPKLANYLLARSDLNEHTCSTVFNGYAMSNRVDLALSTWEQLAARGVDIGAFGSSALMKALAKQRDIPKALQVFDQLLRRRVTFNAYTYNCLLQLCGSAGDIEDALAVYNLQRLETEPANLPDSFTYTALMRAILVSGRVELTQQVFENMLEDSVTPDARLYCIFLTAAARSGNLGLARYLYQHMAATLQLPPPPVAGAADGGKPHQQASNGASNSSRRRPAGASRQAGSANGVADDTSLLSLVNALLFAHAQVGALQAALAVFRQELLGRGLVPDAYTCTALLTACARFTSQLSWEEVKNIVGVMQQFSIPVTTQLGTALINAYRRVRVWRRQLPPQQQQQQQELEQQVWEQQQLAAAGAVVLPGVPRVLCAALAAAGEMLRLLQSRRLATSNTYISMMCFLLEQEQSSACKQVYAAMQAEGIQPDDQGWEKLLQAGQESGMAEFLQQLRTAQEYRAMAAQWGTRQPSGAQQAGQRS